MDEIRQESDERVIELRVHVEGACGPDDADGAAGLEVAVLAKDFDGALYAACDVLGWRRVSAQPVSEDGGRRSGWREKGRLEGEGEAGPELVEERREGSGWGEEGR